MIIPRDAVVTVREYQREGMGLREISKRMVYNRHDIDQSLWHYIGIPDEDLLEGQGGRREYVPDF